MKEEIPSMNFFVSLSLWDFIDEKFHRWNISSMKFYKYLYRDISSMKFSMSNLLLWKRKFHRWIFLSLSPYEISSMKNFIDEIFHRWNFINISTETFHRWNFLWVTAFYERGNSIDEFFCLSLLMRFHRWKISSMKYFIDEIL